MKRIVSFLLVVVLMILSVTGCGKDKGREVFKIGIICPLSGTAGDGIYIQKAAELATQEINDNGGVNGMKIELFVEDDEGTPAKSVTVAQKLVSQSKVDLVIGAQQSSCTLANMVITQEAEIPQMTPASSSPAITAEGNEWIFRTSISDATAANTILKEISKNMEGKTIALLYDSTDFGVNATSMIDEMKKEYGLDIVVKEQFNSDDADFTSILAKVDKAKPDAIVCWGYYAAASQICKQMKQQEMEIPFIGYGFNNPSFTELGAEWAEGAVVASGFTELSAVNNDKVEPFAKAFKEYYDNNAPTQVAAQTYDTLYIIKKAIETLEGKEFTSKELRDAIAKTQYDGVTGAQSFDETGDIVKDCVLVVYDADGEQQLYDLKK